MTCVTKKRLSIQAGSIIYRLSSIPKTPANTPEFIFSKADANYSDGQYEDAILEYQKLIDTYPKDKRVPAAYLKQGLSLINLGRKQEAKYFLNTLIDKYPDSKEAQTARDKLKTI